MDEVERFARRRARLRRQAARDKAVVALCAVALGLIYLLAGAGRACAQPEVPDRARVSYEGAPGYWFRDEIARAMLADLSELPELRAELQLWETRATERDGQVRLLREALDLSIEANGHLHGVIDTAVRMGREATERAEAWYRSPVLWAGVGIVLGVGLAFGAAKLLQLAVE